MSILETHPDLLKEWDYKKNDALGLYPQDLTYGSSKVVWWKCELRGHSWARSIANRTFKGYQCPACKSLKNGTFAENFPAQAQLWHPTKNELLGITPDDVSSSNSTVVWWLCKNGHEWEQKISLVAKKEIPCKICSRVKNGSVAEKLPHLVGFWHPTKNGDLTPEWTASKSNQRIVWLCEEGHEWIAPPSRLAFSGSGCPKCPRTTVRMKHPVVLDSPLAIYWDAEKNREHGFDGTVLRLGSVVKAFWRCENDHTWQMRISLFATKEGCPECLLGTKSASGYMRHPALAIGDPDVAQEWHPVNNGDLTPHDVSTASGKSVWWLCSEGHEYENSVSNRTILKQGCGVCYALRSGKTVASSAAHEEWHTVKNKGVDPAQIVSTSSTKYWWLCPEGHEYKSSPSIKIAAGAGCPKCHYLRNGTVAVMFSEIAQEWHPTRNGDSTPSDFAPFSKRQVWWQCSKNSTHEWITAIGARTGLNSGCPHCNPQYSLAEKEVVEFLQSYGVTVVENKRDLFPGRKLEVDLFLPDFGIAIEYNGLYWHSETFGKGKHSHVEKLELCNALGVNLIQIWEDDWIERKHIVKQGLLHRLGLSNQRRVFARKTVIREIGKDEARSFLNENHIQGFTPGSLYIALEAESEIVAVAVYTMRGDLAYLERYATSAVVVGGFTKLSQYAEKELKERGATSLITFADRTLSQGHLYENNGWVEDKILSPDYMYLVNNERVHKFNYRLKRFKNDPNLFWEEGLTERELALANNLPRIWDAGKIRYIKHL